LWQRSQRHRLGMALVVPEQPLPPLLQMLVVTNP
jgi:hypothetical protein